jgi:hypothetical protein
MMVGMTRTRLLAAVAGLVVTGGAVTMLIALVATPGAWWQGYVSEAGTARQPYATAYRTGLIVLAAGVGLLGLALRPDKRLPGGWPDRVRDGSVTAAALLTAAALAGASGVVPCTDRCPLPPYEPTTVADVVHAGASIAGLVVLAGAMAATWFAEVRAATRRLAAGAAALMVPLGAVFGLSLLTVGRSLFGALAERLILIIAVSWVVGTAALSSYEWHRGTVSRRG